MRMRLRVVETGAAALELPRTATTTTARGEEDAARIREAPEEERCALRATEESI